MKRYLFYLLLALLPGAVFAATGADLVGKWAIEPFNYPQAEGIDFKITGTLVLDNNNACDAQYNVFVTAPIGGDTDAFIKYDVPGTGSYRLEGDALKVALDDMSVTYKVGEIKNGEPGETMDFEGAGLMGDLMKTIYDGMFDMMASMFKNMQYDIVSASPTEIVTTYNNQSVTLKKID